MEDSQKLAAKHPIINWFIHNQVAANLLMLGILLTGLYTVGFFGFFGQTSKLRLEAFPSSPDSTVTVFASVNGSTPEDIEKGITNKLEEALQGIQGIEKTSSISTDNSALISVTKTADYDIDKLYDDIKTQVDAVGTLPTEVEKITVKKIGWKPSILWVTLHGSASEKILKAEGKRLKNRLLNSPFIEKISTAGMRDTEISIEISENTLKEYRLTLSQVANAINNESLDLSSGTLETEQGNLNLRIKAQAQNQTDYENVVIRAETDGSMIRLKDIATVTDGFSEQEFYAGFNGQPSLTLRLKSGQNANVVEADKAATDIVNEFSQTLPDNVTVTIWNNRVSFVKDRINLFARNSATGIILVFLLLTLFLNLRLAFWVALGIPVALSGALIAMSFFDISINLITLFGFILVLGIVVDDAIIIGESIYSWKKRTNNAADATLRGTTRVSVAATFGVLTTVAAFLPLTQIDGNIGDILGQIGLVVIFCLLFSLVESKLILPSHLYHTKVSTKEEAGKKGVWQKVQTSIAQGLEVLVEKTYLPVLKIALRQRYFTLLIFLSTFILAAGTVIGGILPVAIMPKVESQTISLTVEMDNNIPVSHTIDIAKKASEVLRAVDNELMQEQNSENPNITNISVFNTNNTTFMVQAGLASADTRTLSAPKITNRWREAMGYIAGAKSTDFSARQRWGAGDIEAHILSDNRQNQQLASKALLSALSNIDGVKDAKTSLSATNNEIRIDLKPEATIYGITKVQLAKTVRAAFYGQQVERLQRNGEEVRVMVRYPKSERKTIADLYQLYVRNDKGVAIPISAIADLSYANSPKEIEHIDGKRAVSVIANINKEENSSAAVMEILTRTVIPRIEQQYDVQVSFGGEAEDDKKASYSMSLGFLISLAMIYVLLAIPLKSYTRPIIIMSAIPFGIIGAILGHLLLGMTMSMLSVFGIIALSGVVVNDSLLLLTTIQQHRNEGMDVREAIERTGVRRFRPVILTSITTFVGLMPILFETSFQAQFLIPMAVSLGFGILFATAITLVLIPIIYAIFNDISKLFFKSAHK